MGENESEVQSTEQPDLDLDDNGDTKRDPAMYAEINKRFQENRLIKKQAILDAGKRYQQPERSLEPGLVEKYLPPEVVAFLDAHSKVENEVVDTALLIRDIKESFPNANLEIKLENDDTLSISHDRVKDNDRLTHTWKLRPSKNGEKAQLEYTINTVPMKLPLATH